MALRGTCALAFVAFVASAIVTACAAVAGVDRGSDDDIKLPPRAEEVDSGGDERPDEPDAPAFQPPPADAAPVMVDAAPPIDAAPKPGTWLQANGQDCGPFCSSRGQTNIASPEGAKCTSGENIPASALAAGIMYDKCFPSCNAHLSGQNPMSYGKNCYASGQNKDGDSSDVTRGCFCR